VVSLRTVASRDEKTTRVLCADAHGFSLHAAVCCGAHQRKQLERLRRCITRSAIVNGRFLEHAMSAPGSRVAVRMSEKLTFDAAPSPRAGNPRSPVTHSTLIV
jgi:hypothetical protein